MSLLYNEIVNTYEKISSTTSRIMITEILVNLLKKASPEDVDKIVYLTQGKIYPDYVGIELGVAEKLMARAIALASGENYDKVIQLLKTKGDLGMVAQEILTRKKQAGILQFIQEEEKKLTVSEVYDTLVKVSKASGEGAQDIKIRLLTGLLKKATPIEAKYITRTVIGTLRLGLADMTILDAIAIAYLKSKEFRQIVERAYNLTSDLGYVAKIALIEGIEGLKK
jgi:ATP-dependent DNA ligase